MCERLWRPAPLTSNYDGLLYSNFRNYAPPPFLPQICPPFFWGQFSQNSLVGDAWLKASLVHQHTLCHPPKMWALLVPKTGRTVKSIYSHNLFSSFATKKWYFYRKYAPPQTQLGSSQYGEVFQNKQISWLKISSYTPIFVSTSSGPTFSVTHWIRDASIPKLGWFFWKTSNFKRPLRPPSCPRFRKLCCAFSNEIFRIGLTPLSDSVWLRLNQTRQNLPDRPDLPSWRQQPVVAKKESCFEDIRLFAIKVRIFNFSHIIPFFVLSAFQRAAELHSFISMNQLVLVNLSNIRFSGPHFVPIWSPFLLLKIPISLKIR